MRAYQFTINYWAIQTEPADSSKLSLQGKLDEILTICDGGDLFSDFCGVKHDAWTCLIDGSLCCSTSLIPLSDDGSFFMGGVVALALGTFFVESGPSLCKGGGGGGGGGVATKYRVRVANSFPPRKANCIMKLKHDLQARSSYH